MARRRRRQDVIKNQRPLKTMKPVRLTSLSKNLITRALKSVPSYRRPLLSTIATRKINMERRRVTRDVFPRRLKYVLRQIKESPARLLDHDCRKSYSKLLSWRSAQGAGGRRRTKRELSNNRAQHKIKDC